MKTVTKLFWRWDLALCLAMAAMFILLPDIDLTVAGWFYDGNEFYLNHNPLVYAIYRGFANIHFLILAAGLLALLWLAFQRGQQARYWRKSVIYLLLCLIVAPGLMVNAVLKDNSIGRARPVHLQQFGGEDTFTPAFVYSGQCQKNCSFTSGHAALGFYFISLGWLFRSRRLFVAGMVIGTIVGATRIMQGGHFLSDVVFSFWVVYFSSLALAKLFSLSMGPQSAPRRWRFASAQV